MVETPTILHPYEGRSTLTERQWAAVRALCFGYEWIARTDGMELFLLGLAYKSTSGFRPTDEARKLIEPWYEDMNLSGF